MYSETNKWGEATLDSRGAKINTGQAMAAGCSIAPLTSVPASFVYQTTDPATNQATGFPTRLRISLPVRRRALSLP